MQLYLELKKHLAVIGLKEPRKGQTSIFNRINVGILTIFGVCFFSSTAYLMFDAVTFQNYAEAFFPWMTLFFIWGGFLNGILKTMDIYRIFDTTSAVIEKRKAIAMRRIRQMMIIDLVYSAGSKDPIERCLYDETNKTIEKWMIIAYLVFVNISLPLASAPLLIVSYYLYFQLGWGADSFIVYEYLK